MAKPLKELLGIMVAEDGADLFLSVDKQPTMRGGKGIYVIDETPLTDENTLDFAGEIMSERQKQDFFESNEMNMAFEIANLGRFRTSIFRQKGHVGLVIRQVKLIVPTIDELGLPQIF